MTAPLTLKQRIVEYIRSSSRFTCAEVVDHLSKQIYIPEVKRVHKYLAELQKEGRVICVSPKRGRYPAIYEAVQHD